MNKTVNILWVATFGIFALASSLAAVNPWEILATSPGAIESATQGTAGDVCILEQLQFTHRTPAAGESIKCSLPLTERIFLSPGGNVYASISYDGEQEMLNAERLTLYAVDGTALWSITDHPANDVYPLDSGGAVAVSRNVNVRDNQVYFFSEDGKLLRQLPLPAPGEVKASSSSDRILINSAIEGAILFDSQGNELAKLGPAYRTSISRDGRWAAILHGPKMSIYHEGKLAYDAELGGEIVRGATFSVGSQYLAAFTDHALDLLENPGGRVLLQRQLDLQGELSFTSVDLTGDASCIAVGIERDLGESVKGPDRHPEGQIRLYDKDGSVCYQKNLTYTRWNTTTPRVNLSPDGRQLLVLTRDEVMRASLKDLCGNGGER